MNLRYMAFFLCFAFLVLHSVFLTECFADQPQSHEEKEVSLLDCVKKALQSNPKLLSKIDERRAAKSRYKQAKTANQPRVKAEETFTRMREPLSFALPGAPQMAIGDDKLQIKTLRVSQPLYTGGKIENSIKAAGSEVNIRRFSEVQHREALICQVVEAYISVMKANAFQQIASQALYDTEGHARQVENMLLFGSVVRNDLLKIQVSVSERKENLIRANNATKLSCNFLENLIGEELSGDVTTAEFSYMVMPPADEKKAMELARNNHPALLAMRESLRMHRYAALAAKGDLLPTIGLQWNLNSGTQLNESQSNWDATLYVGFNIFDAGEARAKVKETKIGHQKAVHDLEGLERDISLAVQQALLQIEEAKARLEVAKEAEAQAKESMRLTEESFKAGSATSQSLLDDETALVAAEQRRITAEFDRILAETHLWFSIGGLERALFSTAQLSVDASAASIATMSQEIFATGESK